MEFYVIFRIKRGFNDYSRNSRDFALRVRRGGQDVEAFNDNDNQLFQVRSLYKLIGNQILYFPYLFVPMTPAT